MSGTTACVQCRELLRHVHAKNNEIARLREELGELALFKARKAHELRNRIDGTTATAAAAPPANRG